MYVFGGCDDFVLKTCLKYDTTTSKWTNIADMNICRESGSSTVFEGKIIVSGGQNNTGLKSVEAYDHHENKWNHLPNMIEERCRHGAVSMGNKMFVIGGYKNSTWSLTCEIFDSSSRKFTSIKKMVRLYNLNYSDTSVVSIGYKVLFFYSTSCNANNNFQVFDVLKDQWCLMENDFIEAKHYISCSKLPIV